MSGPATTAGTSLEPGPDAPPRHFELRYRPDIDGLRGVAVLAVVAFHAGLNGAPGGFVGVDVFFVISGYLITSLIVGDMAGGAFSLARFYERRVRRIFPALFTVLAACSLMALLIFAPENMRQFGDSLTATALFFSNFFFSAKTDYFDAPLDTHPLLHTWSLAVEEQFYIVFPLVLMLAFRFGRKGWIGVILALFAGSFVASVWMTGTDSVAAFYLTTTRAWELMLGALLAAGAIPAIRNQIARELAALGGIGLIAVAVFTFSPDTPFPGWAALVPCLGAVLLIQCAGGETQPLVSRALSLRPVLFVGLISYSLYLWHWPLLVFARYLKFGPLSTVQVVLIIAASFVLAALSYVFIERPFRRKEAPIGRPALFRGAAAVVSVTVLFGLASVWTGGFPRRYAPEIASVLQAAAAFDQDTELKSCRNRAPADACVFGAAVKPAYAVWGDSHALVMLRTLGDLAAQRNQAFRAYVNIGCAPVADFNREKRPCAISNNAVLEVLESSRDIRKVILMGHYEPYLHELGSGSTDLHESGNSFAHKLELTVSRLLAAGKTVVIVYPVPEAESRPPELIGRLLVSGRDPASGNIPFAKFERRQKDIFAILDRTGAAEDVIRIYPHKSLCDTERCLVYNGDGILYRDKHHLTEAGAALAGAAFRSVFAKD